MFRMKPALGCGNRSCRAVDLAAGVHSGTAFQGVATTGSHLVLPVGLKISTTFWHRLARSPALNLITRCCIFPGRSLFEKPYSFHGYI